VLDLGTGSGVLSIAASIMGAESITAVDVDVQAVEAAKANVAANRVDVQCSTTSVQELARLGVLFDVVLANVLVTTHEEVAAAAIRTLAPGGCLVVSGFLSHQRHRVHEAYREHRPSLQESHSRISGDWRATVLAECG
jgi:ribosomal protein L11 methyltransferase